MEVMVLDRAHAGNAAAELERHHQTALIYSTLHGEPCHLLSVSTLPDDADTSLEAEQVSIIPSSW